MSSTEVLILHGGALGDCALTLHLSAGIRAANPGSRILLAARSPLAVWAARHGLVEGSVAHESLALHLLYGQPVQEPCDLPERFHPYGRIVSLLGGPDEVVSRGLAEVAAGPLFCIDPRPTPDTLSCGRHITEQWAEDLRRGGLAVDPQVYAAVSSRTSESGTVLIHPGSGGVAKCCPLEALEQVVSRFQASGSFARWMIGPAEIERGGQELLRRLRSTADIAYLEDVVAAADEVTRTDTYIGNDCGMTHVAAIAGCRTVALFGPTDPRVWGPRGRDCHILAFPTPGHPTAGWADEVIRLAAHQ